MFKKIKRPLPECFLWILPICIVFPLTQQIWSDSYYMIATGKYILENGIPKTNPFLAVDGFDIAIQNWLYCVIQYLFSLCDGLIGIQFLSLLQYILFSFTCYQLIKRRGNGRREAAAFTLFADVCMSYVMCAARPAVLTFVWLLLIIYALDEYKKTQSKIIFFVLPAASIFTANIQSSNLIFFLCPVLAWIAAWIMEYFKRDVSDKGAAYKSLCPILLITLIAVFVAFLNPYGIENVLYLFHSLGHVDAEELTAISFNSCDVPFIIFGPVVILSVLLDMSVMSKEIDYYRLFLLIGFSILSYTCKRNLIFLIPALMPVWKNVCVLFAAVKEKVRVAWSKQIQNIASHRMFVKALVIGVSTIFLVLWGLQLKNSIFFSNDLRKQIYQMEDAGNVLKFFDDNGIDLNNVSVWPGNAALEMFGAKVLLEPRLEVEDKLINHKEDLYTEYKKAQDEYDSAQLDEYFEKQSFDYYLVVTGSKMAVYFDMSDQYERCEKLDSLTIYRKC